MPGVKIISNEAQEKEETERKESWM